MTQFSRQMALMSVVFATFTLVVGAVTFQVSGGTRILGFVTMGVTVLCTAMFVTGFVKSRKL